MKNTAYYVYDSSGERVRKVVVKSNIIETRFYLCDYEYFTKTVNGVLSEETQTLHINAEKEKVALADNHISQITNLTTVRFQLTNHLGSASLELDETGLYYYGMRYYAAPLARFVSVDPLQFKYPFYTPFQYAGNKPVSFIDLDGAEEKSPEYWKQVNRITAQYGFTNEGAGKIDALQKQYELKYINEQSRKHNSAGAKAIDNAKPSGTITATDSMADYRENWNAMNSPLINNYIKIDPFIKGASSGAFAGMAYIGAEAYVMEGIQADLWKRVGGGASDAIGQFSNNYFFQGKNFKESIYDINMISVGASAFNPENSVLAYIGDDFISNTFQYRKSEGFKIGSIKEIAIGTSGGFVFGSIAGKTNGGILRISENLENSSSLYLNGAINQSNYLFHYFSKELQDIQIKSAQSQSIKSALLKQTNLIISTFGQEGKNYTSTEINK